MDAQAGEGSILLVKKLAGLLLVILGCLLVAVGLNGGAATHIVFGAVLLAAGVTLLVLKIVRRNQNSPVR